MNLAILFSFIGIIIGIIGAVAGIVFILKKSGQGEKQYLKTMVFVLWLAGALLVLGIVFLPRPFNFYLFIPYAVFVPVFLVNSGRRMKRLRREIINQEQPELEEPSTA